MNQDAEGGSFPSITRKYFCKISMMTVSREASPFQNRPAEGSDEEAQILAEQELLLASLRQGFEGLSRRVDREFRKRSPLLSGEEQEDFLLVCRREQARFAEDCSKISAYIRRNFWNLLWGMEESLCNTVLVSKASSGLPYTLRCSVASPGYPSPRGQMLCYISYGELGSGGEARVKEVLSFSSKGFESFAFRRPFNRDSLSRAHVRLINSLTQRGVPRLVNSILWTFLGKHGAVKEGILMPSHLPYPSILSKGLLRAEEKMRIAALLGETLACLHREGVVHLDVKADNVFLDEGDTPFLGDFGYATQIGTLLGYRGSLGCIAPELLWAAGNMERAATSKMDLWSFGVFLFSSFIQEDPFWESQRRVARPGRTSGHAIAYFSFCETVEIERQKLLQGKYPISRELGAVIAGFLALSPGERLSDEDILSGVLQRVPEFVVEDPLPLAPKERVKE